MRSKLHLKLKKGALHQMLGVPPARPISAFKLAEAAHSKSKLERKRAQFAINAKKWKHKGRKNK